MEDMNDNIKENLCDNLKNLFKETEDLLEANQPIDEENNFKISDILDPQCLNNIKRNPKYHFQKFKIYFVKFFTLEEYFFRMEKDKNQIPNENKNTFLITNEPTKEEEPSKSKTKKMNVQIKNKKRLNSWNKNRRFKSANRSNKLDKLNFIENKKNIKNIKKAKSPENSRIKAGLDLNNSSSFFSKNEKRSKDLDKKQSFLNSTGGKNSNSFSYEQNQGLIGIGIKQKVKEEEFPDYKLKLIKSNLNLDENDEMSGKPYEEYCRKIFKIMCMLVVNKEIFLENPTKISYSKIIDFYLNNYFKYSFEIDKPIINILYNNIQDGNELDIVYEMKYEELINISKKFKSFFLINRIETKEKIINIQGNEKITFIGEIAKNIIRQGKEKLSQILNYIKIISIMNTIGDSSIVFKKDENDYKEIFNEYKIICEDYKCSPETKKIFCIITNGDYRKLKIITDLIEDLLKQKYSEEEIKKNILNVINTNKIIFSDETNIEALKDNIFCNYLIFANLKQNNIKHALIYIGDITKINYDEKYQSIFDINLTLKNSKEFLNLNNIKENYFELKKIINQFEKKLSDIALPYKSNMDKVLQTMPKTITNICISTNYKLLKEISDNLIFEAFLFFQTKDKNIVPLFKKSQLYKKINGLFKLKFSFITNKEMNDLVEKVRKCPEQYGKKIIFLVNDANYFTKNADKLFYLPSIVSNICFIRGENQILKFKFVPSAYFIENLPFEIKIKKIISKKMKNRIKVYEKETILLKENLIKKLELDLNYFFNQEKQIYSFLTDIEKLNFNIENEKLNHLLSYFSNALDLFEKMHGKFKEEKKDEIMENIKSKLIILYENIFSYNVYSNIFKILPKIISKIVFDNIKKEISDLVIPLAEVMKVGK